MRVSQSLIDMTKLLWNKKATEYCLRGTPGNPAAVLTGNGTRGMCYKTLVGEAPTQNRGMKAWTGDSTKWK